jgi:hypothetical protein
MRRRDFITLRGGDLAARTRPPTKPADEFVLKFQKPM